MRVKNILCISIFFLLFCVYGFGVSISSAKVSISIPKSQITYTVEVSTKGQTFKIVLDKNVSSIKVNGVVSRFRKITDNQLYIYLVDVPKEEKVEIAINYYHDILSECRNKGFILLSEIMRTLPYLPEEDDSPTETVYVSIEMDHQDSDLTIFLDGRVFSGSKNVNFQKKYGSVIVIGYFNVYSLPDSQVSVVVPKGNEDIALNIINSVRSIREILSIRYGISFPKVLNVIYSRRVNFSESIGNTIILSSFNYLGGNYFSSIESLENFISLVHEILHSTFSKKVDSNVIDIFEGFIQYVSVDVLSKVLGQDSVKDIIFNNYISQVRYSSLYKGGIELIRYKKYPLVFRYISSVVGEVSLISFFRYLITLEKDITFETLRESFRNVVGVSFDLFVPLFDNLPVLWNLDISVANKEVRISSTAPTKVSIPLVVETITYKTNMIVEIQKDSFVNLVFESEVVSALLNPFRSFPELFYHDNYFGIRYPQIVEDFVKEIQYLINTEDFSKVNRRKIIPSKNVRIKISKFFHEKRKIFLNNEIRVGVENIARYNNQIVVEMVLYSLTTYRQGFMIINYGKSYYISDFGVVM